jgi:hypothetical protein
MTDVAAQSDTGPCISIAYTVPVQVIVDLDRGRVTRVVVIDEDVTADRNGYRENRATGEHCTLEQVAAAYAIAETSQWPSWDIGW